MAEREKSEAQSEIALLQDGHRETGAPRGLAHPRWKFLMACVHMHVQWILQ